MDINNDDDIHGITVIATPEQSGEQEVGFFGVHTWYVLVVNLEKSVLMFCDKYQR